MSPYGDGQGGVMTWGCDDMGCRDMGQLGRGCEDMGVSPYGGVQGQGRMMIWGCHIPHPDIVTQEWGFGGVCV